MGRSVGWLAGWLALICTAPSRPACRLFLVRSLPLASSSSSFTSALASTTSASFPSSSFSLHYHQCRAHATRREREREKERQSSQPEPASQPANHQLLSTLQSTIALFIMPSSLLTGSFLLSRLARAQNRPRGLLSRAPLYPPFFLSVFAIPNSCFVSLVLHRRNIFSPELL